MMSLARVANICPGERKRVWGFSQVWAEPLPRGLVPFTASPTDLLQPKRGGAVQKAAQSQEKTMPPSARRPSNLTLPKGLQTTNQRSQEITASDHSPVMPAWPLPVSWGDQGGGTGVPWHGFWGVMRGAGVPWWPMGTAWGVTWSPET